MSKYNALDAALTAYYINSVEGGEEWEDIVSESDEEQELVTGGKRMTKKAGDGRSARSVRSGKSERSEHSEHPVVTLDEVVFFVLDYIKGIKNNGL